MGTLIVLHMTNHNPMLQNIRVQFCGVRFESDAKTPPLIQIFIDKGFIVFLQITKLNL
jgi:hypothetical protein